VLPRHEAEIGGKLPTALEQAGVRDAGRETGSDNRPNPGDVASGTLAERQEATIGPIPGMAASLTLMGSLRWAARMALSSLAICVSIPSSIVAKG